MTAANSEEFTKQSKANEHKIKLTILSNCVSFRNVRFVGIWILQLGHSLLHFLRLSLIQSPQNRWRHAGLMCVSVQLSKQTGHSTSSLTRAFSESKALWCALPLSTRTLVGTPGTTTLMALRVGMMADGCCSRVGVGGAQYVEVSEMSEMCGWKVRYWPGS